MEPGAWLCSSRAQGLQGCGAMHWFMPLQGAHIGMATLLNLTPSPPHTPHQPRNAMGGPPLPWHIGRDQPNMMLITYITHSTLPHHPHVIGPAPTHLWNLCHRGNRAPGAHSVIIIYKPASMPRACIQAGGCHPSVPKAPTHHMPHVCLVWLAATSCGHAYQKPGARSTPK